MKLKINNKLFFSFLVLGLFSLGVFGFLYVHGLDSKEDGYKSIPNTEVVIDDYTDDCREVDNNSSKTYFVPTRTPAEWNAFQDHLPFNVFLTPYGYDCLSMPPCQEGIVQCNGECGEIITPLDDSDCSDIDCGVNNYYYQSGIDSPTGTNYCIYRSYIDITSNHCEGVDGFGSCKEAADCVDYSNSTTRTAGSCEYISGCSGSTPGSVSDYSYGEDAGLCRICDGSGNIIAASDDSSCGVAGIIECEGNDYFIRVGVNSASGSNSCYSVDYLDIVSNRCEGLGDCKDANSDDCTATETILYSTANKCQQIIGCSGLTPGTVANYADGEVCGASRECLNGSCILIATGASYSWKVGTWTACSVTCGGGTQYRSVVCVDGTTNTIVADSNCTIAKPLTSQACNTGSCPSGSGTDVFLYYYRDLGRDANSIWGR